MKLNMIVVITMWLPRRACSHAEINAQPAPNSAPAGQVTFLEDGSILGQATIDETGTASLQMPVLSTGRHNLFASFNGSAEFAPSVSPALIEKPPSDGNGFALTISTQSVDLSSPRGQTLRVTVMPADGFRGNVRLSCAGGLPTGYECVFSPSTLSNGVSDLRILPSATASQHTKAWSAGMAAIFSLVLMGATRRKRTRLILGGLVVAFISMNGCGMSSSLQRQKQVTVLSIQATSGSAESEIIQSAQVAAQF